MVDVSDLHTPPSDALLFTLASLFAAIWVILNLAVAIAGGIGLHRHRKEADSVKRKRLIRDSRTSVFIGLILATLMVPAGLFVGAEARELREAKSQSEESFTRHAAKVLLNDFGYELLVEPGPVILHAYRQPPENQEYHLATDAKGNLAEILIYIESDGQLLVKER